MGNHFRVFLLRNGCVFFFCLQMERFQSMLFWLATASFDVYVVKRFSPELIEWWMERPRARTLQSMRARVILGIWISGGSIIEIEIMREVQEDSCRWGTCETGWWNLATDVNLDRNTLVPHLASFGQPVKPFWVAGFISCDVFDKNCQILQPSQRLLEVWEGQWGLCSFCFVVGLISNSCPL